MVDVNECQRSSQCPQVCSNTEGSFTCSCFIGYKLQTDQVSCTGMAICMVVMQRLETSVMKLQSSIIQLVSGKISLFSTGCDSLHWGYNCNTTCDCSQNALRCDSVRGCVCKTGWSGTLCDTNINECVNSSLCSATEVCVDNPGSYSCPCIAGYQKNASGICHSTDQQLFSIDQCCSRNISAIWIWQRYKC